MPHFLLYALPLCHFLNYRQSLSHHAVCTIAIHSIGSFLAQQRCPNAVNTSIPVWLHEAIPIMSGVGAGVVCAVLCAPLEVVKIALQVQGKRYSAAMLCVT